MAEMSAKYAGWCRKCGGKINIGDKINWTRETGANHVNCPAKTTAPGGNGAPLEPKKVEPAKPFVLPAIPEPSDTLVKAWFSEGEYYSGWMASPHEGLEKLGLGHYLSGWGWTLDGDVVKSLGESFTVAQAIAYAEPKLRAKHDAAEAKRVSKEQQLGGSFAEAARTGQPVVISRWSEECDGSTDECDIDNMTKYAMPDGTTKVTRSHSW